MLGPFSMKGLWVALGELGAVLIRHNITPTHNHKALVGQLSISNPGPFVVQSQLGHKIT